MSQRLLRQVAGPEAVGGKGLSRGTDHVCQVHGLEAHDGADREQLRSSWDARVDSWSEQVEASVAFARVREAVLERADPGGATDAWTWARAAGS